MSHVFISYKKEDEVFAELLNIKVKEAGFDTWIDTDNIPAGGNWREEIDQAIKTAFVLIVIMSPAAQTSEYVTYEWAFALGYNVKVIPVIYKSTKLHPRLEIIQYLDFSGGKQTYHWANLLNTIQLIEQSSDNTLIVPKNTPSHIQKAINALDEPNASDRAGAISALLEVKRDPVVREVLINVLQKPHPYVDVRIEVALALAKFPNMSYIVEQGLIEGLGLNKYHNSAYTALGKLGSKAVPSLLLALQNKQEEVRKGAVKALGIIKDLSAVPSLFKIINDENEKFDLRYSAMRALSQIGDNTTTGQGLFVLLHYRAKEVVEVETEIDKMDSKDIHDEDFRLLSDYLDHIQDELNDLATSVNIEMKEVVKKALFDNFHIDCKICAEIADVIKNTSI